MGWDPYRISFIDDVGKHLSGRVIEPALSTVVHSSCFFHGFSSSADVTSKAQCSDAQGSRFFLIANWPCLGGMSSVRRTLEYQFSRCGIFIHGEMSVIIGP